LRIIGISTAINIVALLILARFGGLKKFEEHFVEAKIVVLPPPDRPKLDEQKVKAPPKKAAVASHTHRAGSHSQGSKPNPNQVHIAIAKGGPAGEGDAGAQQGKLDAGVLPPEPTKSGTGEPAAPVTSAPTSKEAAPTPVVTAPVTKPDPIVKPTVPVAAPIAPHVPTYTEAAPIAGRQPQPTIPDDFRSDALDTTVVVDVTVGPDGAPTTATIAQSTGKRELDRLAVDAAKQWRFKPATRDGEPVESHVRLHIEFQVS